MKEIYFGDTNSFAIRYVPGYKLDNEHHYSYAHLVLGGQVIGNPQEVCYVESWIIQIEHLKEQIKNLPNTYNAEFKNRSDREVFEMIWKSNQLEHEYKPGFHYLPILSNALWQTSIISVDETTDSFLIAAIEQGGLVKFLWEGQREPCPENKRGILYTVSTGKDLVINTIEKFLKKINTDYPNYPLRSSHY